jgi:hypothetical protein
MRRLLALLAAGTALQAFGYASDKQDNYVVSVTLEPKATHEECVAMKDGEKRRYHWKSSAPVDFNIHYHVDPEIFYPVKRDGMRGDGGTFTAKRTIEHCWMWTARGTAAKIEGEIAADRK